MPTKRLRSHSVCYDEYGAGHPLLLIPGLGNSRFSWWKQLKPLSTKYRVINIAKAKPMTLESYQRQLSALLTWGGVSDRLNQISVPTIVVQGVADPLLP